MNVNRQLDDAQRYRAWRIPDSGAGVGVREGHPRQNSDEPTAGLGRPRRAPVSGPQNRREHARPIAAHCGPSVGVDEGDTIERIGRPAGLGQPGGTPVGGLQDRRRYCPR